MSEEVRFLIEEVGDLRKIVGGRSINLNDLKKKSSSVNEELDEIQDKLKSLSKEIEDLRKALAHAKIVADDSASNAAVEALSQDLKTSTDSLFSVLEENKIT